MRPHRKEKIGSLIQEELSKIIGRDLEFDKTVVTITAVEISDDLSQAKVKLGVFPKEKELAALKILEEERRRLQFKLLRKINIKPMPTIKFEIYENGHVAK